MKGGGGLLRSSEDGPAKDEGRCVMGKLVSHFRPQFFCIETSTQGLSSYCGRVARVPRSVSRWTS